MSADARAPELRFVAGKGGVGKTTVAAALALGWGQRARVLLISTDPAHSLADCLDTPVGPAPSALPFAPTVWACQLDADKALRGWLAERRDALAEVARLGTYLADHEVDELLERSLPGVDELIGLLEVERLRAELGCDRVVVDTAPTGHTLRLLQTPSTLGSVGRVLDRMLAKHRLLQERFAGARVDGRGDALAAEVSARAAELERSLRDPDRTAVTWVTLAEAVAAAEAIAGVRALEALGLHVDTLVLNRAPDPGAAPCCPAAAQVAANAAQVWRRVVAQLGGGRRLRVVPERGHEPRGPRALEGVAQALEREVDAQAPARVEPAAASRDPAPPEPGLIEALAPPGVRLVVLTGKGGVGKSSCAAALALALSDARRPLLMSTDPAHSLGAVLDQRAGDEACPARDAPGLTVLEPDVSARFAREQSRYRAAVEGLWGALTRAQLDGSADRAILDELTTLAPTGLDELVGALVLSDELDGAHDPVVVDSAPTGHTLRLLGLPDLALPWLHDAMALLLEYRQALGLGDLGRHVLDLSQRLRRLRDLLRDPAQAAFVVVTRPGELPAAETERLLTALRAKGLRVSALIVNAAGRPDGCATCRQPPDLDRSGRSLPAGRVITAPTWSPPPRGAAELRAWLGAWRTTPGPDVTGEVR